MSWFKVPDVIKVGPRVARRDMTETVDWGLMFHGIPDIWMATRGSGVRIGVIDTGVPAHDDLPAPWMTANVTTDRRDSDNHGHATHVGGIIHASSNGAGTVGVAPCAEVGYVKAIGDNGFGSWEWLARGIDICREWGCHVINMSFGGGGPAPVIREALERAVDAGCICVAAAGNGGPRGVDYPASDPLALAVASFNRNGEISQWSARGPEVDLACPGEAILSTYKQNTYQRLSGTSMAAPFCAGALALIISGGGEIGAEQVRQQIQRITVDKGEAGHDANWGWGVLDLSAPPPPEEAELGRFRISVGASGELVVSVKD